MPEAAWRPTVWQPTRFLVTHIATCMAAVTWAAIDWVVNKKCTTVGGLYGSRGRFGGHHAGSRFGRFGRCAVHRFDNLGRLFLDGGCREAQVRL